MYRWLLALILTPPTLAEQIVKPEIVSLEGPSETKGNIRVLKVGSSGLHFTLVCFTDHKSCVEPIKGHSYYLYDAKTRWRLPNADDISTLEFFEGYFGSYPDAENAALFPTSKGDKFGIYILDSKSATAEVKYKSVDALWTDLLFNRVKRSQLLSQKHAVLVTIEEASVSIVLLEGSSGSLGTVVATDNIGNPSAIAYVHVPVEMKGNTTPLDQIHRGDKVWVLGAIIGVREKGIKGLAFNAIDIILGRVITAPQ